MIDKLTNNHSLLPLLLYSVPTTATPTLFPTFDPTLAPVFAPTFNPTPKVVRVRAVVGVR